MGYSSIQHAKKILKNHLGGFIILMGIGEKKKICFLLFIFLALLFNKEKHV